MKTANKVRKFKRIGASGYANYAIMEYNRKLEGYRIKCYEEHCELFCCEVYPTENEAYNRLEPMLFHEVISMLD